MDSEGFLSCPPQKSVEREPEMQVSPLIAQSINYAGKAFLQVFF